jgi:chemotaxis-related protein WspB
MSAMLFLKFRIGSESYALDTAEIAEVLPLLEITHVPQAPVGIAGLINYRGRSVPVVDLSELMSGEPSRPHISTRLILVHYRGHLLGLIAEHATETMRREAGSFADSGIASDAAPYLGPVTQDGVRLIRWIEVQKLLPATVSGVLFRQAEENAWSSPESPRC